jgi:NADPH:quinone reductase
VGSVPLVPRAVQFDEYGGLDVLTVREIELPELGKEDVLVEVKAAGINPGEASIRKGLLDDKWPATFPSGQGSDLAGVVKEVGIDVVGFALGDEVLGWSWDRSSQAEQVVVPADQLISKPTDLSWEAAGALHVVGVTAFAAVRAVDISAGDAVVVSAAAGGVGTITVQLLKVRGANVVGLASPQHHDWLREKGVTPVAYGEGVTERILAATPDGIDAFIDLFGPQYVDLAVELDLPPAKIETIIAYEKAQEIGAKTEGSGDATTPETLGEMAELVAAGKIEVPIAATYPLDEVREAFEQLEDRHTLGKIVLVP